jgi:outer membrane beta-barrel protein
MDAKLARSPRLAAGVLALAACLVGGTCLAASPAMVDSLAPAPEAEVTAAAVAEDSVAAPAPVTERAVANAPLAAQRMARLTGRPRTVVRTGPSEMDAIAAVYAPGTELAVLGREGDWIHVRLTPTESGWVHVSLCSEFDAQSGEPMRPNPKLYSRTGSYQLAGYAGGYAFDRKSNSLALGGRLAYYVFDRLQVETGVAWTHVHRPAEIVESLFGLSLEAEDFHMLFYQLNATYEILPGRQMVPFVTGGVGSSIMQGRSETSFNFGAGTTLFLSKRTGMRWEARDYVFHSGSDQARRLHHNVEFSLGSVLLF